ncbi:phosphoglycerate mutase [Dokdonella sp.]|uniref:phosphoglycerate mutase n=1 Tax=Dokdonella sp. TaxID=2291710 RepID=UPI003C3C40D3
MTEVFLLLPEWRRCVASPCVAKGTLSRWSAQGDHGPDVDSGEYEAIRPLIQWPGPSMPVAALTRQRDAGDAAGSSWLRADPAHVRADMATARMLAHGQLGLSQTDCESIARDLKPLFGDAGYEFDAKLPDRWYVRASPDARLPAAVPPDEALGDDLKLHLPEGADGRQWRQLFNESQIILHNHPVNARRARIGVVSVNSLWFWGGGRLPAWVRSDLQLVISDRAQLQALADLASVERIPLASGIEQVLNDAGGEKGSILIDLFEARGEQLEDQAFAVLDSLLRRGRIGRIQLLFASGERIQIRAGHRFRFWRRMRELA